MKKISLLGATGSIGQQTLDVIKQHPDELKLVAFSVGENIEACREIIRIFSPEMVSVKTKQAVEQLKEEFCGKDIKFVYGSEGLTEVATYDTTDILLNAVVGSVGLVPTLKAIEARKTIALANKETLVTAGHLVMASAKKHNVSILPVDSEHSAIFQCLQGESEKNIEKIILTASGGSFRDKSRSDLKHVTVEETLNHPNWSMGAKITVDSATMMNKGLEVIEAHWLFDIAYDNIDVLLHKESIIHSLVEFHDSSVIAQLGSPDMRVPIQYALAYPDRLELLNSKKLNLAEIGKLHFSRIDFDRYRCLRFAFEAGKIGGTMPTALNAANEEAVAAFLNGVIPFLSIEDVVETVLAKHMSITNPSLETITNVDKEVRSYVKTLVNDYVNHKV